MREFLLKKISLEKANSGEREGVSLAGGLGLSPQRLFGTFFRKKVRKELDLTLGNFKSNMPGMGDFSVDIQSIAGDALKDMPEAGIGVLADTMTSIDTTAGFTSMLSLGLDSSALNEKFEDSMQEFEDRMSIMQNLRMSEVLVKMMENFYTQLDTMNKDTYEGVKDNADKYYGDAGFKRNEAKGEWSIKVVKSAPMIGGIKYKTYRFDDYEYYQTGHVHLDEYKFNGKTIDFDDVSTFKDMDADVLQVFVNMQKNDLQKKIDEVFFQPGGNDSGGSSSRSRGAGGSGSSNFVSFFEHTGTEMTRLLGDDDHEGYFTKNYQRWMEGEAKRSKNRFEKPLFAGGPSSRQLTQMAATIAAGATGQVWLAAAVNAGFTAYDVAQGNMDWKHGLVQAGVGAAGAMAGGFGGEIYGTYLSQAVTMAASGIDYKEGGGIGWSNDNLKAGVKSGAVSMAMNYVLKNTITNPEYAYISSGIQAGTMSSLDFDTNKWYKIGLNDQNDKWDSLAIGVTSAAGSFVASRTMSWLADNTETYNPKTGSADQNAFEQKNTFNEVFGLGHYTEKLINNFSSNLLLAGYFSKRHDISYADALTTGDGEGNYGTNMWGNALYDASSVGNYLGNLIYEQSSVFEDRQAQKQKEAKRAQAEAERAARRGYPTQQDNNQNQTLLGGLWHGIQKIGEDIANVGRAISDGADSFGNWVAGNGFRTDDEIARAEYNKKLAIAAATNYFLSDEARDVVKDFRGDTKAETEARIYALEQANYDTTGLKAVVGGMRDELARIAYEKKLQAEQQRQSQTEIGYVTDTRLYNENYISANDLNAGADSLGMKILKGAAGGVLTAFAAIMSPFKGTTYGAEKNSIGDYYFSSKSVDREKYSFSNDNTMRHQTQKLIIDILLNGNKDNYGLKKFLNSKYNRNVTQMILNDYKELGGVGFTGEHFEQKFKLLDNVMKEIQKNNASKLLVEQGKFKDTKEARSSIDKLIGSNGGTDKIGYILLSQNSNKGEPVFLRKRDRSILEQFQDALPYTLPGYMGSDMSSGEVDLTIYRKLESKGAAVDFLRAIFHQNMIKKTNMVVSNANSGKRVNFSRRVDYFYKLKFNTHDGAYMRDLKIKKYLFGK